MLKDQTTGIPQIAREALAAMVVQINNLTASIKQMEKRIVAWCRANNAARRLATIPGVGPITASALAATITDPLFQSGRHLAAWPTQALDRGHDGGDPIGAAHQGSGLRLGQRRCSSAARRASSR